jgi:hypothetical protein
VENWMISTRNASASCGQRPAKLGLENMRNVVRSWRLSLKNYTHFRRNIIMVGVTPVPRDIRKTTQIFSSEATKIARLIENITHQSTDQQI